ncbi:unnamed protein product [Caenorhabditis bovis]|uniref:Uncharacterized protein n=1 Tax=Caenorhabditis bovis TaxID=2654633 RepID=A0A8S1EM96_9PELO|nr:unnamed protein product [Caenorhabditis bovis]
MPKLSSSEMAPPPYIPSRDAVSNQAPKNSPRRNRNRRNPTSGYLSDAKTSSISPHGSPKPRLFPFELINQNFSNPLAMPIMGIRSENPAIVEYPLLTRTQEGTMLLSLTAELLVEVCVDRSFRVVSNNNFMAYVNTTGDVSSIVHRFATIVHTIEHVHCKFVAANDRYAVLGPEGVLFSMQNLATAYLVNSSGESTQSLFPSVVAVEKPEFPIKDIDYSLHQLYAESKMGHKAAIQCGDIVQKAGYEPMKPDGTIVIHINGIHIRSNHVTGDVSIDAKPIRMDINTKRSTIHLRTTYIDMAIQDSDKCFVKRADNRIHTSRSGMVVSDGTSNISVDQHGDILSCS